MYRRLLNSTISFFPTEYKVRDATFSYEWFDSDSLPILFMSICVKVVLTSIQASHGFFSQTKFIMTICSGNSIRNVKKGQRLFVDRYHRYMERKMWFSNCQFRSNSLTGWNRKYIQMEIWSLQWEDFKLNWNNGLLHWIWGKVMKLVNREMIHNFLKSSEVKTFKSIDFDQFLIEV